MATGRNYAKSLVGDLDRSFYNTQRDVVKNSTQTNWENIQNQYENLQNKLKKQQEEANKQYAEGLATVASNSYDRTRASNNNLATSGVGASGLTDLVKQADTQQKGQEVANLLKSVGGVTADNVDQLATANAKMTSEENSIAQDLADKLGDIGSNETSAQNSYNSALASLGETMEAREESNKLAAMQRAITAMSNSTSKEESEINDALEALNKRLAIDEVISDEDMTSDQKKKYLTTMLGVSADVADAAINQYDYNNGVYDKDINKLQSSLNKYNNLYNSYLKSYNKELSDNYTDKMPGSYNVSLGTNYGTLGSKTGVDTSKINTYKKNLDKTSSKISELENQLKQYTSKNSNKTIDAILYGK